MKILLFTLIITQTMIAFIQQICDIGTQPNKEDPAMTATAQKIAELLLSIKATTLNVKEPFRYTSGIISPIYTDNRLIISYPDKREIVINEFLELIKTQPLEFDVVAGTATAGIPHAAWIADRLNKPMVYVRGSSKKHGKQNQIEGVINAGDKALVVEDLISTGGSSVDAALALREAGATVSDCVAIFSYQLPQATEKFAQADVNLHTLSDFDTLISTAVAENYLSQTDGDIARSWNKAPDVWGC